MNQKVGRAVLCAPTAATTLLYYTKNGAHGVTRPTSANWFIAPIGVQSWRLKLPRDGPSLRRHLFKRRRGPRGSESGNQAQIGRHSGAQSRIGAMNPFLQRKPKRQRTGAVQDLAEARKHVALACVLECGSPLPLSDERFMESLHGSATAHWDQDPRRIPLTRPSGTLSPTGGEGWGEGVRFMGSSRWGIQRAPELQH